MGFLNTEKSGYNNYDLNIDLIKNQMDHIEKVVDINSVAIGSDFD